MSGPELEYAALVVVCILFGFLIHFLKKAVEAKAEVGGWRGFSSYFTQNWLQTLTMLLTTVGGCLMLWAAEQLNGITGFFMGYCGNSLIDVMGTRVVGAIDVTPKKKETP